MTDAPTPQTTHPGISEAPWPTREITDPSELRALAHPVRFAILDLLAAGPLTATQCGERLGQTPANCSYHLRQLERYGHVARAEGGVGRERPWKIRSEGITWDTSGQPGAAQDRAADALSDVIEDYRFGAWRSYRARRRDEPEQWRVADMSSDVVAWMTAEELRELKGKMMALFAPFVERDHAPERRPDGARAVRYFGYAYPGDER